MSCEKCKSENVELVYDSWQCDDCEHVFQDADSMQEYYDYLVDITRLK